MTARRRQRECARPSLKHLVRAAMSLALSIGSATDQREVSFPKRMLRGRASILSNPRLSCRGLAGSEARISALRSGIAGGRRDLSYANAGREFRQPSPNAVGENADEPLQMRWAFLRSIFAHAITTRRMVVCSACGWVQVSSATVSKVSSRAEAFFSLCDNLHAASDWQLWRPPLKSRKRR